MIGKLLRSPITVALVALLALVAGSGIFDQQPASAAQRVAHLEAQIRCPSCEDLSVAQSTAPSALAVRREIAQLVAAGRSDDQIRQALVAQYGTAVLLSPPRSGASLVLWLAPLLLVVALVGVVLLGWRRRERVDG